MGDGLRLALTTLSVARLRGPRVLDRRTAGQAMALAPLVGLLLGLLAAGLLVAVRELSTSLLGAAVAVSALAALTRGLHLDGLADTADGLASYRPAEQARRVMKSPEVGALGLVTVVLVLLLQVSALAAADAAGRGPAAVVLAAVAGRLAVTAACTRGVPAASPDGLGALVAGTVPRRVPALLLAAGAVALAAGSVADAGAAGHAGVAVLAGLLVAAVLLRHAVRRLGGITGDVLGALVELTATTVLLAMALGGT